MHGKNRDLHGSAPDSAATALLIVDMLVDFKAVGGSALMRKALRAAQAIADLRIRAKRAGVPVVFVNDNSGRWKSDQRRIVADIRSAEPRLAELLRPEPDDYFVVKAKHSGFFRTPLELLLSHLDAHHLIVVGSTDVQCVLFTAVDAYVRDYSLTVPMNCVISIAAADREAAQHVLKKVLKAKLTHSKKMRFKPQQRRLD